MNRTLALDLGTKRTGAAISDELGITAQPVGVRPRTGYKSDLAWVRELMTQYEIDKIIVGYPINMDTTIGERAKASERFVEKIKKDIDVEVILWDERLSTKGATRVLLSADVSRKKRKKVVDQMAAQIILASWLDAQSNKKK